MHFGRFINSQVFGKFRNRKLRVISESGTALHELSIHSSKIDLIMTDSNTLAFVEFRYRRSDQLGGALNSAIHVKK